MCGGFAHLPPSLAFVRSNSGLCCGCRRRIKSGLGLGSPRGSSSSRPGTLQAILNMYTMQHAGRGAGAASYVSLLASRWLLWALCLWRTTGSRACLYCLIKPCRCLGVLVPLGAGPGRREPCSLGPKAGLLYPLWSRGGGRTYLSSHSSLPGLEGC